MQNGSVANGPWTGVVAAANSLSPNLTDCRVVLTCLPQTNDVVRIEHFEGVDERIRKACRQGRD
eukprot:3580744-Rhodomonas_salina.1